MRYALMLRHDPDYTQAVRPDILRRLFTELDEIHPMTGTLTWETWAGPAQGHVRLGWGERGFPMAEEETEEYVDSILVTLASDGINIPEVRDVAWRLASHLAARLRWEIFDSVVGRTLLPDERNRFENSLADWGRGMNPGGALKTDRSAGPGTPRVGG